MERIRDEFTYLPEDKQALKLKKLLFLHGCDVQKDVPVIQAFEEKIIRTEMNSRSCASMADLYVKLWETVPIERSSVRVAIEERYRQREDRENQRLIDADNKERAVKAEQLKKQQTVALQGKINSFKANVASGDELFQRQKYDEAAGFYAKASELFPGEAYPQQRLKQIQEYKARVQAESDRRAELNAKAEQLFRAAESAEFNQANYKQALQAVQAAMNADPGNKKTGDMYKTINIKLDKYKTVWGASKENEW
jgi:tetratricopeptide (TPR) repeat protein